MGHELARRTTDLGAIEEELSRSIERVDKIPVVNEWGQELLGQLHTQAIKNTVETLAAGQQWVDAAESLGISPEAIQELQGMQGDYVRTTREMVAADGEEVKRFVRKLNQAD